MTTTLTHTPDLSTSSHVDFQPTGADWTAFHIYAHGTRATTDHLLVQASRLAREVVASGRASSWFVMRYWEGGPHIRLRLRNLDPTLREELADRLSQMALAAPEQQQLDAKASTVRWRVPMDCDATVGSQQGPCFSQPMSRRLSATQGHASWTTRRGCSACPAA